MSNIPSDREYLRAAKPGDRGWAEREADEHVSANAPKHVQIILTPTLVQYMKNAFMAGYAARMIDEGAQLNTDGWPYFPPTWTGE